MREPLLAFIRAARRAGVPISTAESLDAARALERVGYDDRQRLKDALAASLAKSYEHEVRLDATFELFFSGEPAAAGDDDDAKPDAAENERNAREHGELAALLLARDADRTALAIERAGEAVGLREIELFTQVNAYVRRILERLGGENLRRELLRLRVVATPDASALGERLERLDAALRERVRVHVERHLELFAKRARDEGSDEELPRDLTLSARDPRERARLRAVVRKLARRLATRYGRRRRHPVRGKLDAGRTIHASLRTGGVPFRTIWRKRRIDRPKIVVLCDVSNSVAATVEFVLQFLAALNEAIASLVAFSFTYQAIDVSDVLRRETAEKAVSEILRVTGYRSSAYGASFADFARQYESKLDDRTTLLVVGDARGNYTDPKIRVVERLAKRVKMLVWMNTEPRGSWGSGDSDMDRYRPFCRIAATVRTVGDLETVVREILRSGA